MSSLPLRLASRLTATTPPRWSKRPCWRSPSPGLTMPDRCARRAVGDAVQRATASVASAKIDEAACSSISGGRGLGMVRNGEPVIGASRAMEGQTTSRPMRGEAAVCRLDGPVFRRGPGGGGNGEGGLPRLHSSRLVFVPGTATERAMGRLGRIRRSGAPAARPGNSSPSGMSDVRSYRKTAAWQGGRVRKAVLERQGGRCALCGWPGEDGRGKGMHLAHLVPWPFGADDESNLVGLCPSDHRRFDAGAARRLRAARAAGAADTPGGTFPSTAGSGPSLGGPRERPENPILVGSLGVGPGSSALPPGFAGVWRDDSMSEEVRP